MALIPCPECKKKISESAENCPQCGFPLTSERVMDIKRKQAKSIKAANRGCGIILLGIAAIGIFGVFQSNRTPSHNKSVSTNSSALSELMKYGNTVAAATSGAVVFVSAKQTTKSPMNAYKLLFKTDRAELMSEPGAAPGNAAYIANTGLTKLWSMRFCTENLKAIMSQYGIDMVSGDLSNRRGETQSLALC